MKRLNGEAARRLDTAVDGLLESYAAVGGINHIDGCNLPSLARVVEVLKILDGLLFPGYYEREQLGRRNIRYVIGERCARLQEYLGEEVTKAFEQSLREGKGALVEVDDPAAEAERVVCELLEALPEIREMLYEDAQAALAGDPAARSIVEVLLAYPSIRALAVHRVAHFLHRRRVPLIPRMMSEYVHGQTGIDIHPGAKIGPGLFIDHGTGVVIGETAVLGRWCKLYQGVTLGALSVVKDGEATWDPPKRHPTLEDRVTVYSGATILGGATVIGEGSVIGGNVWLTRSVPPGTTVQIEPPFLRYRDGRSTQRPWDPADYQI